MLAKRIIPCLDVKDGKVIKGIKFNDHVIVGDIIELASRYSNQGADELVFYDISASCEQRTVCLDWIQKVAAQIDIPFCVAGGIRSLQDAEKILCSGADKISINSPALENPNFITQLANEFGSQCVTVGIDSYYQNNNYYVYQYTGVVSKIKKTNYFTPNWLMQVVDRGAGEIVLNCINQDGVRQGYDIEQLAAARKKISIPLVASGGAGSCEHFLDVFQRADVSGALAASVFHRNEISISALKEYLYDNNIEVRHV